MKLSSFRILPLLSAMLLPVAAQADHDHGGGHGGGGWHGGGGNWHGGGGNWHGGNWHGGGWHGGGWGHGYGYGGPRFYARGPVVSYGYGGCYVRRLVPTPWGPRWRMINRCY